MTTLTISKDVEGFKKYLNKTLPKDAEVHFQKKSLGVSEFDVTIKVPQGHRDTLKNLIW